MILPQETAPNVLKDILARVSMYPVVTRNVKAARVLFKKAGVKPTIKDLTESLIAATTGRSNETVCSWVWQHRFCPTTVSEWFTLPLTDAQVYHIAYFMEMTEKAIVRIGPNNMTDK